MAEARLASSRLSHLSLPRRIYKWKNNFSEMKGDVGISLHEKEGEQKDAYTKTGSR